MQHFPEGWIFDEIVGRKKELFSILGLQAPTAEQISTLPQDDDEPPADLDMPVELSDLDLPPDLDD